ncbi:hypothetical protein SK128_015882 [Halocaridina rubra]|uniref:Uncharacterized protein n=1 Tax=Halocaridina rubra TaxID=373956 RepID=A0AAN9AGA6_HALRR
MDRRLMALVFILSLFVLSEAMSTRAGDCSGRCRRQDSRGICRTVFACLSAPVPGASILNSFCRKRCHVLVHGKCRPNFSCLLGKKK